jgi:hypothetical protein
MKKWRAYERLIAKLTADEYDDSYTVIPNAKIKGYISRRKRQIDVLIDYRYNTDISRRIVIDAKNRSRPIDIKDVESFEGLMCDVRAQRGFIVCANGYTKAALKRAQDHIGIRLIPAEGVEDLDLNSWDQCVSEECEDGLVLWDATPGIIINEIIYVNCIGKCDECGRFHVWCWSCGEKKDLENEAEWQCSCKGHWFWLTAIENEDEGNSDSNEEVLLILVLGVIPEVVDRKPL